MTLMVCFLQDHWQCERGAAEETVDNLWWRRGPRVGRESQLRAGWKQTPNLAQRRTSGHTSKCEHCLGLTCFLICSLYSTCIKYTWSFPNDITFKTNFFTLNRKLLKSTCTGIYCLNFCIAFQVRIMFEVQDLKFATLATVSRCGMVWFSEDVLSPEMIYENYLQTLRNVSLEEGEEELPKAALGETEETLSKTLQVMLLCSSTMTALMMWIKLYFYTFYEQIFEFFFYLDWKKWKAHTEFYTFLTSFTYRIMLNWHTCKICFFLKYVIDWYDSNICQIYMWLINTDIISVKYITFENEYYVVYYKQIYI